MAKELSIKELPEQTEFYLDKDRGLVLYYKNESMKALIAIGQIIFFEIKSLRLEFFFEEVLYNKNKINPSGKKDEPSSNDSSNNISDEIIIQNK